MTYDYPVYVRPDILKIVLDATPPSNLANIKAQPPLKSNFVPNKAQAGQWRRNQNRWNAYTSGNCYVLNVQNRTSSHSFYVQAYGKNVHQAVRRYYRGLDDNSNWTWKCTKVVAVYDCTDRGSAARGDLLYSA